MIKCNIDDLLGKEALVLVIKGKDYKVSDSTIEELLESQKLLQESLSIEGLRDVVKSMLNISEEEVAKFGVRSLNLIIEKVMAFLSGADEKMLNSLREKSSSLRP